MPRCGAPGVWQRPVIATRLLLRFAHDVPLLRVPELRTRACPCWNESCMRGLPVQFCRREAGPTSMVCAACDAAARARAPCSWRGPHAAHTHAPRADAPCVHVLCAGALRDCILRTALATMLLRMFAISRCACVRCTCLRPARWRHVVVRKPAVKPPSLDLPMLEESSETKRPWVKA